MRSCHNVQPSLVMQKNTNNVKKRTTKKRNTLSKNGEKDPNRTKTQIVDKNRTFEKRN